MADCIEIVDWGKHYENYRTRELKVMTWVPMPNRHDGDGYTLLLDHQHGASHFGAWCALVELASRCKNGTASVPSAGKYRDSARYDASDHPFGRGLLMRENGEPHNEKTLERITRIPEAVWKEVIPRLISIGWIRNKGVGIVSVGSTDIVPTEYPMNGNEMNGNEMNGMEWNGKKEGNTLSGKPDSLPIQEIVQYLNAKTGRDFSYKTDDTRVKIGARWREGRTLDDFKAVIDFQIKEWGADPKMAKYLRPETLFGTKFESYLQAARSGSVVNVPKKIPHCPDCKAEMTTRICTECGCSLIDEHGKQIREAV